TQGLFAFAPNAILHGAGGDDLIEAREGNETIIASSGNDTVDGGAGFDVMRFQGALGDFDHEGGLDGLRISGGSTDSLLEGIERVQFSDASIALDMDGAAGSVARILGVVFGAAAASQPAWVGIGLSLADGGMSETTLMTLALEVGLGAGASNAQVVSLLYQNLAGEAPTQDIIDFFSGEIEQGTYTQVSLALLAASLPLNLQLIGMSEMEMEGVVYVPY
ncbi:MAG TPA: hypothetical protein VK996_13205, partial [Ramlibacter sp.]|nr:hypothetical protein [Ramlibacter sp.]